MVFEGYSLAESMNEQTSTIENLESHVEFLEEQVNALQERNDKQAHTIRGLDRELADTVNELESQAAEDDGLLTVAVLDAIADLRTLGDVPLNLVESAVENIIDDLRGAVGVD